MPILIKKLICQFMRNNKFNNVPFGNLFDLKLYALSCFNNSAIKKKVRCFVAFWIFTIKICTFLDMIKKILKTFSPVWSWYYINTVLRWWNRCPLTFCLRMGNKKESLEDKKGECEPWDINSMFFTVRYSLVWRTFLELALSWWKMMRHFLLFFLISSKALSKKNYYIPLNINSSSIPWSNVCDVSITIEERTSVNDQLLSDSVHCQIMIVRHFRHIIIFKKKIVRSSLGSER